MKKILLVLLAIVMCLTFALTGCKPTAGTPEETTEPDGDGPETTEAPEEEVDIYNELGTWPIVKDEFKDQIQFTVFVAPEPWLGDFNEGNMKTQNYEKMTNMKVTFDIIARAEMDEKINLLLASNEELPDVFMCSLGTARLALYGSEGVFIPLNEYIETIAPGIEYLLSLQPAALSQMTFPDGNIYALGEFNECYHCDMSQRMWINDTWITNLGLEYPETTDEFADVLRAFKNDDPNENGLADEYPLVCPTDFWNGKIDGFLINPFQFCANTGGGDRLFLDNGEIKCAAVQDGWKEAMKYLNMLYEEGLLDKDCFSSTQETLRPLTESENGNQVGAAPGGYIGGIVNMEGDKVYDYLWLDPLEGPTGLKQTPYYYTSVNLCYAITNQCEVPEAAFRWGDMQNVWSKESLEGKYDTEEYGLGITYRLGVDGEFGLDGRAASDGYRLTASILVYGEPHNYHWGQPCPTVVTNESRFSSVSPTDKWYNETELYKARTSYTPYGNRENVVPLLLQSAEEAEELTEYSNVSTTISQWVAYFVTGEKDIDADWEEYTGLLEEYGLQGIIDIYQGAYDRVYGE